MRSEDPAEVLVLIDEIGIPRKDKEALISGFQDTIGMTLDEKFGTLSFSAPLESLSNISSAVAAFIDRYQLAGKIFPVIRRDSIDREFKDRLLRYEVFQKYWEVEDERAVILTYDISHKEGRNAKRFYRLQEIGALRIFHSCYWIPEEKADAVIEDFEEIVQESREYQAKDPSKRVVEYHYRVIRCYPIGSPEGLKKWRDLQLSLFMNKIHTLYSRTRGKSSYFSYISSAFEALVDNKREEALKKIKRMRYWKRVAEGELKPYLDAHLRRMQAMGIASQEVLETVQIEEYNEEGSLVQVRERLSHDINNALERLNDALSSLHEEVYTFLELHATPSQ